LPSATRRRAHRAPGAAISAYFAASHRLDAALLAAVCVVEVAVVLEDLTFVANAMLATMLANVFDMNVSTSGSLLSRLSHQRNGLSTHPPSKLGMLPS